MGGDLNDDDERADECFDAKCDDPLPPAHRHASHSEVRDDDQAEHDAQLPRQ